MKILFLLLSLAVFHCGCATQRQYESPRLTGLQNRVIHSRLIGKQFGATYKEVWWSSISTLQLHGFVLRDADVETGYIYGVWQNVFETEGSNASVLPMIMSSRSLEVIEVSLTLEDMGKKGTKVRISSRGDANGESMDCATFASRFFASLNKELLLKTAEK